MFDANKSRNNGDIFHFLYSFHLELHCESMCEKKEWWELCDMLKYIPKKYSYIRMIFIFGSKIRSQVLEHSKTSFKVLCLKNKSCIKITMVK